jgi:hypothetical protein
MKGKHARGGHAAKGRKCRDGGDPGEDANRGRSPTPAKDDGNPFVIREAEKSKSIGKIGGIKSRPRADRKRGGACRASGGGADVTPYSSAGNALRRRGGSTAHR